jgi:HSP20 family protein
MTNRSIVPFGWAGAGLPDRAANDDPFVRLWHDVDRLFSDMVRGTGLAGWPGAGTIGLPVDVADAGDAVRVVAELPGVDEKDVSVELQGDVLVIRGEKKAEERREEEGYYLSERRYGTFARTLRLPFAAEADKVQATFRNGVLTVTMPKPAELQQKTQRIEVRKAA